MQNASFQNEPAKSAAWSAIKLARAAALDEPLWTPFGAMDCDAAGRAGIDRAVTTAQMITAAGNPVDIQFTCADNNIAALDGPKALQVGYLLAQKIQALHRQAQAFRTQIEAATLDELPAIVWPAAS